MKHFFRMTALICALIMVGCTLTGCFGLFDAIFGDEPDYSYSSNETVYTEPSYAAGGNIWNFTAGETSFLTNTPTDVYFTAEADLFRSDVALYSNDAFLAAMYDDGTGGDYFANDGIYTCIFTINTAVADSYDFHARIGSTQSEHLDLFVYDLPTEEDFAEAENIWSEFENIQSSYADGSGFVPEQQVNAVISDTEAMVRALQEQGIVHNYWAEEDNVYVKFSSGLPMIFAPHVEGTDAVGDNVSVNVITHQPFRASYSEAVRPYLTYPDDAATIIANTFENYFFSGSNNHDEREVTLDLIRSFGPNQVVFWHGHGGYNSAVSSYLVTGSYYHEEFGSQYAEDLAKNRLVLCGGGRLAFTSKYIDTYCGSMENSFFYLGSCDSGKDSILADSFLNKGAEAVIANSETIYSIYNLIMEYSTAQYLCSVNPNTGNYYTLDEALTAAKNDNGQDDRNYGSGIKANATPLIFGGTDALNYRLRDEKQQLIGPTRPPYGPTLPPSPTPEPTPEPPATPYAAYKSILQNYTWINYCPSDLSEIPADRYAEFWLGNYYLCDINKDGIDELIVMAGQSLADTSLTFFTYSGGKVYHAGSVNCNPSLGICASPYKTGIVSVEHQGGYGSDVYIDMSGLSVVITDTQSYNYESASYVDPKGSDYRWLNAYSVHDTSALDAKM